MERSSCRGQWNTDLATERPSYSPAVTLDVRLVEGLERLGAVTTLLQRSRLADPLAGLWEAADVQWWWRRPRATDSLPTPVWYDELGPVAAVLLTDWGDSWQCDALVLPGAIDIAVVWTALLEHIERAPTTRLEVLARDDDKTLITLLGNSGFASTDEIGGISWMPAGRQPPLRSLPDGFALLDRSRPGRRPHPMRQRNGEVVEERLRECSLYDAELDLAAITDEGEVAGYALFWLDEITRVGILEPMRVEDVHQRRGLGAALLAAGLERLVAKGASRFKIQFGDGPGRHLYLSTGFEQTSSDRTFVRQQAPS
jgi:predicted N-acetyltransferase YhbS